MSFVTALVDHQVIPDKGLLGQLFYGTYVKLNIFGLLGDGYTIYLAGLVVLVVIALAAAAIAEKLAGAKPGKSLMTPLLLALLGSYIFSAYVKLPFDYMLQGVPIVAALLGAIVFGVFYVLISKQASPKKAAA